MSLSCAGQILAPAVGWLAQPPKAPTTGRASIRTQMRSDLPFGVPPFAWSVYSRYETHPVQDLANARQSVAIRPGQQSSSRLRLLKWLMTGVNSGQQYYYGPCSAAHVVRFMQKNDKFIGGLPSAMLPGPRARSTLQRGTAESGGKDGAWAFERQFGALHGTQMRQNCNGQHSRMAGDSLRVGPVVINNSSACQTAPAARDLACNSSPTVRGPTRCHTVVPCPHHGADGMISPSSRLMALFFPPVQPAYLPTLIAVPINRCTSPGDFDLLLQSIYIKCKPHHPTIAGSLPAPARAVTGGPAPPSGQKKQGIA